MPLNVAQAPSPVLVCAFLAILVTASCAPLKPLPSPFTPSRLPARVALPAPPLAERDSSLLGWRFVIDPGHGGREHGAPSPEKGNAPEADLNLAVSLLLGGLLQTSGAEVAYTRTSDVTAGESGLALGRELERRAAFSNEYRPDLFLSIHHNGSANPDHNRLEVYFKLRSRGPAREAGRAILTELGTLYPDFDSTLLAGNFSVLRNLTDEGVLVECAYLSDRSLSPRLETITLLKAEATSIYKGVLQFALASETRPSELPRAETEADRGADTLIADTRPRLLVVRERGERFAAPPTLETASVVVEMTASGADPSATLLEIENRAPGVVLLLRAARPFQVVHYFRSANGERLAVALAKAFPGAHVVAGSEYLLTQTSMSAVLFQSPTLDADEIKTVIETLTSAMTLIPR